MKICVDEICAKSLVVVRVLYESFTKEKLNFVFIVLYLEANFNSTLLSDNV